MKTNRFFAFVGSLALALTLTACGGDDSSDDSNSATNDNSASGNSSESVELTGEDVPNTTEAQFGDTVTWGTGHEVTVGAPKVYDFDFDLESSDFGVVFQIEITHTNNSPEEFSSNHLDISVPSADGEEHPLYDEDNPSPFSGLKTGDTTTYTRLFRIPGSEEDLKDVVVAVDVPPLTEGVVTFAH